MTVVLREINRRHLNRKNKVMVEKISISTNILKRKHNSLQIWRCRNCEKFDVAPKTAFRASGVANPVNLNLHRQCLQHCVGFFWLFCRPFLDVGLLVKLGIPRRLVTTIGRAANMPNHTTVCLRHGPNDRVTRQSLL